MIDLASLRLEAARMAGLAFSGTCSADGTTTSLVDAVLRDAGVDTDYLENGFLYLPTALAANRQRNIATDGFTPATGALEPSRAWSALPTNGQAYQAFSLVPPIPQAGIPLSWNRAINAALSNIWYIDEMVIGRGTQRGDKRFSLTRGEVLLIAAISVIGGSAITVTPPTGWTLFYNDNTDDTDLALYVFYKRSNPADGETFTFTINQSAVASGVITAYVDAQSADPGNIGGAVESTGATLTSVAPAVATDDGGYVVHVYAAKRGVSFAPPDGEDVRADAVAHSADTAVWVMICDVAADTTGQYPAATATLEASARNIGMSFSLAPVTAARFIAPISQGTDGNNGAGATTLVISKPHNLPNDDWRANEDSIRSVVLRTIDSSGVARDSDQDKGGRDWWPVSIGSDLGVELLKAPSQSQLVVVKVHRPYPALTLDTDETECATERIVAGAIWQCYELLNRSAAAIGQYKAESALWQQEFLNIEARHRPKSIVRY